MKKSSDEEDGREKFLKVSISFDTSEDNSKIEDRAKSAVPWKIRNLFISFYRRIHSRSTKWLYLGLNAEKYLSYFIDS
jgi:hypothetical protein